MFLRLPQVVRNIAVPSNDSQKSLYLTPTTATEPQLFESNPIEAPSSEFIEKEVLTKQTPQNQVTEDTLTIPSDIKTPQEEISSSLTNFLILMKKIFGLEQWMKLKICL
jgi:hypothetical protein